MFYLSNHLRNTRSSCSFVTFIKRRNHRYPKQRQHYDATQQFRHKQLVLKFGYRLTNYAFTLSCMDTLSPIERSARMSLIKGKNSRPEMKIRKLVYSLGYRYRLHVKTIPGSPDLVFRGKKKIIFVHGCFWHRHESCHLARVPKTRPEFWIPKLEKNRQRDAAILQKLSADGWKVLVIWECQIKHKDELILSIKDFLEAEGAVNESR